MRNLLRAVDVALDEATDRLDEHKDKLMDSAGIEEDQPLRRMTDEMFDDMDNRMEVILYTMEDYAEHPDDKVREFVTDLKAEVESLGDLLKGERKKVVDEEVEADFEEIESRMAKIKKMLRKKKEETDD